MSYLHTMLASLSWDLLIPGMMFLASLAGLVWVLWKAQQRSDFDLAGMLRDEGGKASSTRALAFGAFGSSTWVLATLTLTKQLTPEYFLYYLLAWSGSLILKAAFDKWDGQLPWAKGGPA